MSTLILLLIDLGLLLVVALFLGELAERVRLPAICGQLLAGVVLGPTLLGAAVPSLERAFFPAHNTILVAARKDFLQVGVILFVFFIGLEIDVGLMRERLRTIVPISGLGLLIPLVSGFLCVKLWPTLWGGPDPRALPYVIAVCVAISALVVIGGIISDLNLMQTTVGQMILSAAVIDDLMGWLGFAAVAAAFGAAAPGSFAVWQTVLIILAAFGATVTLARKMGVFAESWVEKHVRRATLALGLVLAAALLASAVAEGIGAHAFFGALLVGLTLSGGHKEFLWPVERMVRGFFAPLYFGAVGLSVDFIHSFDLLLVAVVCALAFFGKLVGVSMGARLGGFGWRESAAIAAGMNARGAIEILLATLALDQNLIDARIFEAIVVMAVLSSLVAGFALARLMGVRGAVRARPRPRPALARVRAA